MVLTKNRPAVQRSEVSGEKSDDDSSSSRSSSSESGNGEGVQKKGTTSYQDKNDYRRRQGNGNIGQTVATASTDKDSRLSGAPSRGAPSSITVRTSKSDDWYVQGTNLGMDSTQLITLKTQIKKVMFPHCKVMHTQADWDDISPGSFGSLLMDYCHVNEKLRVGFWNTVKIQAKRHLKSCTQQVNTKVKAVYWGKNHFSTRS